MLFGLVSIGLRELEYLLDLDLVVVVVGHMTSSISGFASVGISCDGLHNERYHMITLHTLHTIPD